uniref:Carbohydrate kinase PfkB domain-containing protein n=1 Tax=Amphimedon queenslandica TaxID=400682 RepID=A0A1X7VBV0_AMPQE
MLYWICYRTALVVEEIVRSHSVVPATIGVIDGKIHVGLTSSQLDQLADPEEPKVKISCRDLPVACSKGLSGGTTVSGTLFIANSVNIKIFVTGGMGGVHRHGNISFDISSDLTQLSRTPVGVVSSGIKSILDIPRTLELLETLGITVVTFGPSKEFPAFFTPKSGCYVDNNMETPLDCARLLDANARQETNSGLLIAVPIPTDVACEGLAVEDAIQVALKEADTSNVTGKEVTPFILKRVNELTKGESLKANIALIKNNASVGSKIANELSQLRQYPCETRHFIPPMQNLTTPSNYQPVIVGGSIIDIVVKAKTTPITREGTIPGSLWSCDGGVGRNIAEYLARRDCNPLLVSVVGEDENGGKIKRRLTELKMSTRGILVKEGASTASYCVVLEESGEVHCGIGDLEINKHLTVDWVKQFSTVPPSFLCFDANIPIHVITYICNTFSQYNTPIWFEPTCVRNSVKPITSGVIDKITYASPNLSELHCMHNSLVENEKQAPPLNVSNLEDIINTVLSLSDPLLYNGMQNLLVTLGTHGLMYVTKDEALLYPSAPSGYPVSILNVSGAGDCLVGGVISSLLEGHSIDASIKIGLLSAHTSLRSSETVAIPNQTDFGDWMKVESIICKRK